MSRREQEAIRIQLWSYNYDPEPTGIGVVSTVWARSLHARGHSVEVVSAHPHYPDARWGTSLRPRREVRDGVDVLRLPLWIGRTNARERYRQELSFTAAQTLATPFLSRPDVLVSTSPSFPALLPAIANVRARRLPWVLWLHDLLPEGATATGLIDEHSPMIRLARRLEHAAYRAADRIVVLSRAFTTNLLAKGVPEDKIDLIYDPATRVPKALAKPGQVAGQLRILSMGNIGYSQGLTALIAAFEGRSELTSEARLVLTGTGVAAQDAQNEISSSRIEMLGLVEDDQLEHQLQASDVGLVSQRHEGSEFNIPSKLMNFMAYGLPVLAAVNPDGEVARLVRESRAGWVVDSSDAEAFPREVARLSGAKTEIRECGERARSYAEQHFMPATFADQFERTLRSVSARRR